MPTEFQYSYDSVIGQLNETIGALETLIGSIQEHQTAAAADTAHNDSLLDELNSKVSRLNAVKTIVTMDCCDANCAGIIRGDRL